MKEKNFVSATVYVHNAAETLGDFLRGLVDVLTENFENSEIICVNDDSKDKSEDIIRTVANESDNVSITILNMSHYHGLELAMSAGCDLAIGDFVFEFDVPSHDYDLKLIMDVYKKALDGNDIVSASSDRRQKSSSSLFYSIYNSFSKSKTKMQTETFRILSRRAINRVKGMNTSVIYRKAMYVNCGLPADVIKYQSNGRGFLRGDESGYRRGVAVDTLIMFTDMGIRISSFLTVAMMLITAFMVIYTLAIYLGGNPVEGWTTTVLFLSVAFFGLFAILTVIIKYLQLILDLVFKKKDYNFYSIEKLR